VEEPRVKVKVCLVGANTGCKTELVRKHVLDTCSDRWIEEVGTKVTKKELKLRPSAAEPPVTVDLMVWDLVSEPGFRGLLRDEHIRGSSGVIAVTDMTRRRTLDELHEWIEEIEDVTGPVPVAVIGANHDKTENLEITEAEVAAAAKAHDAPCFFEPSGAGESVEAAFRYLAEAFLPSALGGRGGRTARGERESRRAHPPR